MKKGRVNASNDDVDDEESIEDVATAEAVLDIAMPVGELDLESVKKAWDALTYAVSKKRMSLATYLQEGLPLAIEKDKIIIAFSNEKTFYKESLETSDNLLLISKVFSDKLRRPVAVGYRSVDELDTSQPSTDEPLVKSVLEAFDGKIVSKWHNE